MARILHGSSKPCANMAPILLEKSSQSKISYFRLKVIIKQYVPWFDVSVNDSDMEFFMKICQPTSSAQDYVKPLFPIKSSTLAPYMAEQVIL